MQQRHRWLRLSIRLMLPVFALAGFGSIASLALPGMAWETELSRSDSPSGFYRASVIRVTGESACGNGGIAVRVVRHRSIFKTGEDIPFCLHGKGTVKVQWSDASTLAIVCSGCEGYEIANEDWQHLHYAFDVERP